MLKQSASVAAEGKWFAAVSQTPAAQALLRRLEQGGALSGAGISPAAQPFFAAWLRRSFPDRPLVVVTDGLKTQEVFQQDLETWLQTPLLFYPAWEVLPHESRLPHANVISDRLETLIALSTPASAKAIPPIVLASVTALLQRTFPVQFLKSHARKLNRGDRIEPQDLMDWLEAEGYEPEAQVTQKGEMALRGGILDIYPVTSPWPVRLEFFGDELESLRYFEPLTQISREQITTITLPPAGELGLLKQSRQPEKQLIEPAALLDHLPPETIFLFCDPALLAASADNYTAQIPPEDPFLIPWEEFQQQITARKMTLVEVFETESTEESPAWEEAEDQPLAPDPSTILFDFPSLEAFRPLNTTAQEPQIADAQRREFFSQLHRWSRQGWSVVVFCNNQGERQRLGEIWTDYGLDDDARPVLRLGPLSRGFMLESSKWVVVTDAEIFGRYKIQRPRRQKSAHAQAVRSAMEVDFTDFEEGDYVVHLQHGIGRFVGLKILPAAPSRTDPVPQTSPGAGQECLVIEYASGNPDLPAPKLYVPVTEAHLVGKYVGAGKARPVLNTLGGTRWAKAKAHAEHTVKDLAGELLAIQAARDSQPGHAFAADNTWQREFESAFLYEETRDQLRAIQETKADMERPKPMDRLICGDVGFGKTEIAIRAAFKAVMDGRQVAILVPTTVLAQQHFNTFRERMADYPVRVELLSRFRAPRDRAKVISDLPVGAVDIVIGTHRLLQKDIAFKDLGLVIIDEEQRFGVMHKERFKQMRRLVDVLTLSATPIPRTLYLALTGARDLSAIETPPRDRLPVETIVAQYDERLIRDAIQRELDRGGQVFFLHNRVNTIEPLAQKLRTLLPKARIVVGHGQMPPNDLEKVMTAFVNGQADVLLSTTIIESGLDIPNANTIIIDRADRFGLSELYQLRGRVGRYKHQAHAYLLVPRHAGLLSDARKRIAALKQYSTLGSGFKIAMRDLEIRGAGNLLGPQQSGEITAVGFELYCQLLKQSISVLKGEKVKPRLETQARFDFLALTQGESEIRVVAPEESKKKSKAGFDIIIPRDVATYLPEKTEAGPPPKKLEKAPCYIPFAYISEARARIEIYRKLAQASDKAALTQLEKEVRDRFGPPPAAVELLLLVGELKILAGEKNVTVVEVKDDKLMLTRNNDFIMLGGKFPRLTGANARARLKEIKKLLLAL